MKIPKWLNPCALWRQRLRDIDHDMLFPAIRRQKHPVIPTERQIANAIIVHCTHDHAWQCDPAEYSERDMKVIVECAKVL